MVDPDPRLLSALKLSAPPAMRNWPSNELLAESVTLPPLTHTFPKPVFPNVPMTPFTSQLPALKKRDAVWLPPLRIVTFSSIVAVLVEPFLK